jgi:DNA polymerase-4
MQLCRACLTMHADPAAPCCAFPHQLAHPELAELTIAHLDCDAFYAAVEKRDDTSLAAKPVIIGGGTRGVVSSACYIARAYGVRAAMPMFKALKACPDAVVIKPDMAKYVAEGRVIRERMRALTPLVQPLSIDEAFMDLSGLEALHGAPPALMLARLQREIAEDRGLTVSIGLSFNKFLAKLASDLEKPRGFVVIGRAEAVERIAPLPVTVLPGVGAAGARALERLRVHRVEDLRVVGEAALVRALGDFGARLFALAEARDDRPVDPAGEAKSLSAETTFSNDLRDLEPLEDRLWLVCERVSARARAAGLSGRTVTLKLKDAAFRSRTRRRTLPEPTLLAARLFAEARALLAAEADGRTPFRLIGVALTDLSDSAAADRGDLLDARTPKRAALEAAVAAARGRFGAEALQTGRGLRSRRGKDG